MTVLVCVCVCIWCLCVYNQRSYSRCLRFYFLLSFFPSSFAFVRLPFHVSFSCFTFLLFRFFHVQSWQRFKPSAMKFKSAEKCCLHDNKRAVRGAEGGNANWLTWAQEFQGNFKVQQWLNNGTAQHKRHSTKRRWRCRWNCDWDWRTDADTRWPHKMQHAKGAQLTAAKDKHKRFPLPSFLTLFLSKVNSSYGFTLLPTAITAIFSYFCHVSSSSRSGKAAEGCLYSAAVAN